MKISVFGLGYVGTVTAACFAKLGHKVVGVDIVKYKIDSINNGNSPIKEKGLDQLVKTQVKQGALFATENLKEAVLNTEISFICVGTPPLKSGDMNISILKKVCREIGASLKEKKYHLIVIRSTIFPGSLEVLKQIFEEASGKICEKDFDIVVNPEFLREGSAIRDFLNPPYILVGSERISACRAAMNSYKGIKARKFIVRTGAAQMIKYVNNTWHAIKVTFANEVGAICKKKNIDSKKLMKLFCEDKDLNLSSYYLMPGFAFGGSCLPKDASALMKNSESLGIKIPLINAIMESNREHVTRALDLIKSKGKKNIGFLGLTFKPDTDDIRGNPILAVINKLIDEKYSIKIFDRLIDKSNIKLLDKSYRKEIFDLLMREDLKTKIQGISNLFSDLESVLKQDIIVISNRDLILKGYLKSLPKGKIIIDLQNLFSDPSFKADYDHL
jgi:GDP-mannose 6-dehydrogenase